DCAIRGDNSVFVFHVLARTEIDSSAGGFNQEPTRGNVPKTDSLFNVSVETSAGDIGHVERALPSKRHLRTRWIIRCSSGRPASIVSSVLESPTEMTASARSARSLT